MKTTDKRVMTRSIGMVIALATAALSAGKASAQAAVKELVSVSDIDGVVSSRILENGDLELTLENGRTVTIAAADFVNQNGVLLVEASALAQAGLAAEVAAGGGSTFLIVGLGALAAGGVAVAAGGGGEEPPAINNPPTITSATTATTAENTSAAVYTATATDIDGNAITFSIVGGADASRFAINPSTGALTFIASPNFETPNDANTDNRYEVIIGASDGKITVQQPIVVTVTNVNDIAPVITSVAAVAAAENRTTAFTATATDAEGDPVTFALSGADAGLFNINATTGVVTFKVAPDFEAPADAGANNVYDVVVTASDGRNSTTQNVAVTVTNAINITGTAAAETLTGTAAIEELSGLDGNDGIDGAGGSDTVTTGTGSDTIVYQGNAFDGADVSATGRQIIANEDFITDFSFATDKYEFNAREYQLTSDVSFVSLDANAAGAAIPAGANVIVLRNSDNDANPATPFVAGNALAQVAALVNTDGPGFIVYYNSVLQQNRILYSANLNDVTADVKVVSRHTDLTGQAAIDALASFTANNFDFDRPPAFTSAATVNAVENRTVAFTATAPDGDGTAPTFSLSGADAGLFNINATTGVVTFKVAPDFEAPADAGANNVYDVVVTASDGRNSTTQNVAVTVTNAINITGTANADTLTGTAAIEELSGLGGNDRLDAAGGSDTVTTGLGSDTIVYQGNAFDGADVSAPGRQIIGNEDFITDFNFATPLTAISVASASTTPAVLTAALAGRIYFNVHSTAFPSGEVRGQAALVSDNRAPDGTGSVTFNSALNGANEVATPPVVTKAAGIATITFTVAANGTVTYTTQIDLRDFDVARLTVGHLHEAPVGSNGPVVLDIVGNARTNGSIAGSVEADKYEFNAREYQLTSDVSFVSLDANAAGAAIPAGANVIVLRNSDNDGNPATPFVAGTALAQVAALVNTDGPGFIVYYNSVLQQNRILYSANLNDVTADVKVVSRHTDLTGQAAIDALASFTASNFDFDRPPAFTSAATANAIENRTTAFTATAPDGDGTAPTFSLSGADAGLFNINATTGVVTFKVAPDFEAPADAGANNVYDVVVTASDGRNSTTQNVAVTVTNAINITGTANADTLTGTAAIEELSGLGGNDRLDAAGGSDTVTTGLGSDTIVYQGNAFDGADVSATGRQIIGNEDFITDFNFATALTTISVASASTTPAVLTAALAGRIYFNVHSTAFPSGEVRGQAALVSDNRAPDGTGSVTFNSVLNGANEVATPPVVTNATGVATITFTVAANGTVTYTTQIDLRDFDVARLTVGHLHEAPAGSNGPVVQDIVGNARTNGSIAGSVEADKYEFDASDYGVTTALSFVSLNANAAGAAIPEGANVIVLRNSDNDANPATPFVAGTALAQVAALVSTDGPGFIVYFNSVLQQNRVLYSANLNDVTADVKVVSRHSDLTGQAAIDALAKFTANNFDLRGDTFVGTAAAETLSGTAASDGFTGLAGADTITTGAGRDTVTYDATSLGSAPDTLTDFDVAQDRFLLDASAFNVTGPLKVQNALAANIVNNGSNVIILRDSDNDANSATVFNARSAAQLIGTAVNADGAGFFVYFNSALNLNRLVYSTNLNDGAAPLTVLGAVGTTTGQAAIDQLALYGSSNFAFGSSAPVSTLAEAPTSRLLTVGEVADLNVASPSGAFPISGATETNGFGFEYLGVGARDFAIADAQTLDDVAGMNLLPDVPVIASIEGF